MKRIAVPILLSTTTRVDRALLVVIDEKTTGAILFAGCIDDLTAKGNDR